MLLLELFICNLLIDQNPQNVARINMGASPE